MSARTKIVVLHMKELIYSGVIAAFGILFIILFVIVFSRDEEKASSIPPTQQNSDQTDTPTSGTNIYIPGIYTTELMLGGQTIDVEVLVDSDGISSVHLVNLSEAVTTMYPLLQPTIDSISIQLRDTQSIDTVTYTAESKYTSLVLLEAIKESLEKAKITEETAKD